MRWKWPGADSGSASSTLAFVGPAKPNSFGGLWHSGHMIRAAAIAWVVIATLSVGRAVLIHYPRHSGCFSIFAEAGQAWLAGNDVYSARPGLSVFRYSPLAAALLAPIGALPDVLGSAALRAVNLAVFVLGIFCWGKCATPITLSRRQLAAFLLLVAPLVARSLIDVQVNGLTIGLLLLGVTALVQDRPNWAAACFVLACLVKAYVISLVLVLMLVYPRQLIFRFPAFVVLGFVLPFAFQRPDYVLRQYELWIHWGLNNRGFGEFEDLWFLLANLGVMLDQRGHSIVQLAAAAAVAAFCFWRRRASVPRKELVCTVLGLTCGWMVLLGPATEGCTYVLFAPAMAWVVLEAYLAAVPAWQRVLALSSFVIFTVGQIAFWFPWGGALNATIGTFPLTAILAVAAIVVAELRWQPAPELATGWEEPAFLPLASAANRMPGKQERKAA